MEIREILALEGVYWIDANFDADGPEWDKASIIATGAIANVMAAILMCATVEEYREQVKKRDN